MNDENSTEQIKKYVFYTNSQNSNSNSKEELEILIPEVSTSFEHFKPLVASFDTFLTFCQK